MSISLTYHNLNRRNKSAPLSSRLLVSPVGASRVRDPLTIFEVLTMAVVFAGCNGVYREAAIQLRLTWYLGT